jgi:arginine N-succinyltransferase
MYVIRPITSRDLDPYVSMAFHASAGMSNMPRNPELLTLNLKKSLSSFASDLHKPDREFYLFVIENDLTGQIGGVCGIYARIGTDQPEYYYCREMIQPKPFQHLPIAKELQILKPLSVRYGPSEICSLYLMPEFRKAGLGKLLSLSRFLFMACFPERFEDVIIAEMRGYVDSSNKSPFWEHIGRHFLHLDYLEAAHLKESDSHFIPFVLPEYPIYLDLLPQTVREVIGKVHVHTVPALKILLQEGFEITDRYDIFDGGPTISAKKTAIRTCKESRQMAVQEITANPINSEEYLICNCKLDFRSCFSPLHISDKNQAILPADTAKALLIQPGDPIRFISKIPDKV